jgi:GTP cyclohydrolase II
MSMPRVTLSFAQSLDGSIAAQPGQRTILSGSESMAYTHRLRAAHDAILVGVGTVIADNPKLTVRLATGAHPQPVVLDSALRVPLECNLIASPVRPLWVMCAHDAPAERQRALEDLGVQVLRVDAPGAYHTRWPALLGALAARSVGTLMVEGGARVIASMLAGSAAHRLAVTIAPRLLGGLRALDAPADPAPWQRLVNVRYEKLGADMILEADLVNSP